MRACPICNVGELASTKETIKHPALSSVVLVNVEVLRCPECGEWIQRIPRTEELDRKVAELLIAKPAALDREEFRFLRKWLGLSSKDFGLIISRDVATISRYETGQYVIPQTVDKMLRLLVANHEPVAAYPIDKLTQIDFSKTADSVRPKLRFSGDGWEVAA